LNPIEEIWAELETRSNSELFFVKGKSYRIMVLHASDKNGISNFRINKYEFHSIGMLHGELHLSFITNRYPNNRIMCTAFSPEFIENKLEELGLTFEDLV
jgi:hypothetical protein